LKTVGVSSVTGAGLEDFINAVENSRAEYEKYDHYRLEYSPGLKFLQRLCS